MTRIILSVWLLSILASSCRTVDDSPMTTSTIITPETITGDTELGSALSEVLYLQLLNIEIASGIKVPNQKLHTSRGLLQCHSDGILKTCYLRARLVDAALSSRESTEADIVRAFWTHAAQTRPSVINDPLLVADTVCDYIGPKSPPYNMEKASCRIEHIRRANEIVVADKSASVIAESLRGDQVTTDNDKTSLTGTLLCRAINDKQSTCMTRGFVGKDISQDIRELDGKVSKSLLQTFVKTHRDHAMLNAKGKRVVYSRPQEFLAQVKCTIDLANKNIYGGYICRLNI